MRLRGDRAAKSERFILEPLPGLAGDGTESTAQRLHQFRTPGALRRQLEVPFDDVATLLDLPEVVPAAASPCSAGDVPVEVNEVEKWCPFQPSRAPGVVQRTHLDD